MANEEVNLGSLLLIIVISVFVFRYLFFKSPSLPNQGGRDSQAALRTREEAVQSIQQVFPHIDRRTILWDLQRTGGSISATTERILAGNLATPPITFQPLPPPGSSPQTSQAQAQAASTAATSATGVGSLSGPDLITRYNLKNRLETASPTASNAESLDKKGKGWSSNKEERQEMFQKRREDMIIAARKKMEAKLAAQN